MDFDTMRFALAKFSRRQIAWFAGRVSLRVLPALANCDVPFASWPKDIVPDYVFSIFRATNATLTISQSVNALFSPDSFRSAASEEIRKAAERAAANATAASYEGCYTAREVGLAVTTYLQAYATGYLGATAATEAFCWHARRLFPDSDYDQYEETWIPDTSATEADIRLLQATPTDKLPAQWPDLWPQRSSS